MADNNGATTTTAVTPATASAPAAARPNGLGHVALRSPREELAHISQLMDDFARRIFGYGPGQYLFGPQWLDRFTGDSFFQTSEDGPQVDVYEKDDAYQVFVSLPGYSPDQIHVEATGDSFAIYGERTTLQPDEAASARQKNGVTSESRFRIETSLPGEVAPAQVSATFANGILEISMPKTEKARTNVIQVPVKPA